MPLGVVVGIATYTAIVVSGDGGGGRGPGWNRRQPFVASLCFPCTCSAVPCRLSNTFSNSMAICGRGPAAKAFGQLLNFNCMLVLLPVLWHVLALVHACKCCKFRLAKVSSSLLLSRPFMHCLARLFYIKTLSWSENYTRREHRLSHHHCVHHRLCRDWCECRRTVHFGLSNAMSCF